MPIIRRKQRFSVPDDGRGNQRIGKYHGMAQCVFLDIEHCPGRYFLIYLDDVNIPFLKWKTGCSSEEFPWRFHRL
jgi:hypothetical protein